jgi:hypothetical protein
MINDHIYKREEPYSHNITMSVLRGSVAEGVAGISAAVMAVLGLANVMPFIMLFISTIFVGAALSFDGLSVSTRFAKMISDNEEDSGYHRMEIGSVSAETLGGIIGMTLGILALIGLAPIGLITTAAIVYGTSVIIGASANLRLNMIEISRNFNPSTQSLAKAMVGATSDIQMLVGFAAIILGILAFIGFVPVIMLLVAMLSIGVANFISGAAISGKMFSVIHK